MGLFDLFKSQTTEPQTETTVECAWCLDEQGTLKNQGPTDSHGICEDHSNEIRYQYHARKFNRTPSYTTRYRDNQQAYWEEED